MIGGKVIETIAVNDRVWINCREEQSGDECAIYVEACPKARSVSEGDAVWWQGDKALWTPKCIKDADLSKPHGQDYDIVLKRIGYSGVKRPEPQPV